MVTLSQTIPAIPMRNAAAAVDLYRDRLGFEDVWGQVLHPRKPPRGQLCWIARPDPGRRSCRILVGGVEQLYEELRDADVLHPVSKAGPNDTDFGTREFATLDLNGNLISFFERRDA